MTHRVSLSLSRWRAAQSLLCPYKGQETYGLCWSAIASEENQNKSTIVCVGAQLALPIRSERSQLLLLAVIDRRCCLIGRE